MVMMTIVTSIKNMDMTIKNDDDNNEKGAATTIKGNTNIVILENCHRRVI